MANGAVPQNETGPSRKGRAFSDSKILILLQGKARTICPGEGRRVKIRTGDNPFSRLFGVDSSGFPVEQRDLLRPVTAVFLPDEFEFKYTLSRLEIGESGVVDLRRKIVDMAKDIFDDLV